MISIEMYLNSFSCIIQVTRKLTAFKLHILTLFPRFNSQPQIFLSTQNTVGGVSEWVPQPQFFYCEIISTI